jgi:hypothetical protein
MSIVLIRSGYKPPPAAGGRVTITALSIQDIVD